MMTKQYGNPKPLAETPPWLPVRTAEAAAFMQVHPKTLLRWARATDGPQPMPRDMYLDNQLYWRLGDLLAWWEGWNVVEPRTFQQICKDYRASPPVPLSVALHQEWPKKPTAQQRWRRRRLTNTT